MREECFSQTEDVIGDYVYSYTGSRYEQTFLCFERAVLGKKEILEEYLPDYIIVWGNRLYEGLPDWNGEHAILKVSENDKTDVWIYTINGKRIPAMRVLHPSSPVGKNWMYWHAFYEDFWQFRP